MTPTHNRPEQASRHAPEATARAYFAALDAGDFESFEAGITDDITFEMPFPAPGMAARIEGRAQVVAFYRAALGSMQRSRAVFDRIIPTSEPAVLVAEGHGESVTLDGRPYRNRYAWIFAFAPDGRIASLREYADPLIIIDAFGSPSGDGAQPGARS